MLTKFSHYACGARLNATSANNRRHDHQRKRRKTLLHTRSGSFMPKLIRAAYPLKRDTGLLAEPHMPTYIKVSRMQNKLYPSLRSRRIHLSGFTLIELMVSLAVLGILASLAAPSFSAMIKKYRVNAIREELVASIQTARTEAVRRGRPVVLIQEVDTSVCTETITPGEDWNCGWRMVVDADSSGDISTAERGAPLKVALLPTGYDVQHTNKGNQIEFGPWGQATGVGQNFVIYNTKDGLSGDATRIICISAGGRIRVVKGSSCS